MQPDLSFEHLDAVLGASFEDLKLDSQEKHQLTELLALLPPDRCRYVRNRAFDRVREQLNEGHTEHSLAALKWLEHVIKCLDRADAEPALEPSCHFSPGDACRDKIIELIRRASTSVWVCVFTLSDDRITAALIDAFQQGIDVRIISDDDKSEDRGSDIDRLQALGVAVRLDDSPYHMHHKFALFDESVLLNGSFNWTRSASEVNEENILITAEPKLVAGYSAQFQQLWASFS